MIKLNETNCHDCYYATKINTDTYRCRRKKYDVEKKTCFVPRKEDADGERKDGAEIEGKEDAMP